MTCLLPGIVTGKQRGSWFVVRGPWSVVRGPWSVVVLVFVFVFVLA